MGGGGTIAGTVVIGAGASLAPAAGSKAPATFTTSGALTLSAAATYHYTGKLKSRRVQTDLVVANGVIINGATLSTHLKVTGSAQLGTVLTVISNTGANPINGTFSNLPGGGIVIVGITNFQADYEGGDGDDLTLTVVP